MRFKLRFTFSSHTYNEKFTEATHYIKLLKRNGFEFIFEEECYILLNSLDEILEIMKITGHDIILIDIAGDMSELELEIYDDWRE